MAYQGMVVDLEELERFIDSLTRFNAALGEASDKLTSHWVRLGDVWRDEQYGKFAAMWDETVHGIDDYLQEAPGYVTYLRRKAEQVSDFLRG